MIEILAESHDNVLVAKATGKLSVADYTNTIIPQLDKVLAEHSRASALMIVGTDFRGWEVAALWMDFKYGVQHRNDFDKLAILTEKSLLKTLITLCQFMVSAEVKLFPEQDFSTALAWINNKD